MTTVVVTGAGAGVGRAIAREFGSRGAAVALLARDEDRLAAAAEEVDAYGGRGLAVPVDVADAAAVEAAASRVEAELGPIDVWVNNAMVAVFAPVAETTAEEYRRVTDVCYLGYVHGTLAALRRMRPRGRGTIVQVGSALAYRPIPLQSAYCAAKHAVNGFTQALRCELLHEHSGVRVTSVHLPALNTPQFEWVRSRLPRRPRPVAPVYQPEVAARAVVWAAEHAPRELKVGASTLLAVYATRVAPGLVDRYLARTGWSSQQTDETARSDRADNLLRPVPGGVEAHGRFGESAHERSPLLALRTALRR